MLRGWDVRDSTDISFADRSQQLFSFWLAAGTKRSVAESEYAKACDTVLNRRGQMLRTSPGRYRLQNSWNPKPVHVGFVGGKVTLWQVFIRLVQFSLVSIIPPVPDSYSFICHWHDINSATYSFEKKKRNSWIVQVGEVVTVTCVQFEFRSMYGLRLQVLAMLLWPTKRKYVGHLQIGHDCILFTSYPCCIRQYIDCLKRKYCCVQRTQFSVNSD